MDNTTARQAAEPGNPLPKRLVQLVSAIARYVDEADRARGREQAGEEAERKP